MDKPIDIEALNNENLNIYLLRHCESLFNTGDDILSRDVSLSEKGKEQASLLEGTFDMVMVSPLKRGKETLQLSKIKYSEIIDNFYHIREHIKDNCDLLEGENEEKETDEQLDYRISKFLDFLLYMTKKNDRVLIISHADFIWRLTSEKGELYKWL